jgi:hypothetical protein
MPTFDTWLLRQTDRDDRVGDLARVFEQIRRVQDATGELPLDLTHDDLDAQNADDDLHSALNRARIEWTDLQLTTARASRAEITPADRYRPASYGRSTSVRLRLHPYMVSLRYVSTRDAEHIVIVVPTIFREALHRLVARDAIYKGSHVESLAGNIRFQLDDAYHAQRHSS